MLSYENFIPSQKIDPTGVFQSYQDTGQTLRCYGMLWQQRTEKNYNGIVLLSTNDVTIVIVRQEGCDKVGVYTFDLIRK